MAAAVLALLVMAGLLLRPLLFTQYGHGAEATAIYIGQVQEIEGLPVDPDRTYEEMSLRWVGWYVGLTTVVFASLGVALVLHRALRGTEPRWVLPAMLLIWTVATTLARPAITPDHPWASRRLVVLVLPAFVLFAVWFLAWLTRRLQQLEGHGAPTRPPAVGAVVAAAAGAVVMLVPTAITATGVMTYRSDIGTVQSTRALCEAVPDDASVLILGDLDSGYMQLIRGMCGVPTASVASAAPEDDVPRVIGEIRERGRVPVLAASSPEEIRPYAARGRPLEHPFNVYAEQDSSTLTEPPSGPWRFDGEVWIAVLA